MTDDDKPPSEPTVLISNRQQAPLDEPGLVALAKATLIGEEHAAAELSVSFVEASEIEDLHVRYMDEPGPTDVLSFPLGEVDENGRSVLGDVVIAPEVAARNNPTDPEGELRLLLVHGILHLLGYDHEVDAARAVMWARQERYSGVRAP